MLVYIRFDQFKGILLGKYKKFLITPKLKAKQKKSNKSRIFLELMWDIISWSCTYFLVLPSFKSVLERNIIMQEILQTEIWDTGYILFLGDILDSVNNSDKYLLRFLLTANCPNKNTMGTDCDWDYKETLLKDMDCVQLKSKKRDICL